MAKVLIVDDDLGFQRILGISLQTYKKDFEVILANNGEEAIGVLGQTNIDLLITDIQMPKVDGLALLAYVNEHKPRMPCIVMTAYSIPEMDAKYESVSLRFLKKPFAIDKLVKAMVQALKPERLNGALRGISVANFLQMIEREQKTCLLEVSSPGNDKGFFYFENGELYDASYRGLNGEAAAFELIALDDGASISFGDLPDQEIARRINTNLIGLIMEALQRKDDADG